MNANKAITAEFLLMAYDPDLIGKAWWACRATAKSGRREGKATRSHTCSPYRGTTPIHCADGTVFRFTLPRTAVVAARVFDLNGRLVAELSAGPLGVANMSSRGTAETSPALGWGPA